MSKQKAQTSLQPIQRSEYQWEIPPGGRMRVPAILYASAELIAGMDQKVFEQAANVASLPGIVKASYAMPDAHWGYGFPIGGVAAFDPAQGGAISAGGVGFDISCGVRSLHTGLARKDIEANRERLADSLFQMIPAGLGSTGSIRLSDQQMDAMLSGGAAWAVKQGYGYREDLERIEENGCMAGAEPGMVSDFAKKRQREEMGTLGSGNHYLEVQRVAEIFDREGEAGLVALPDVGKLPKAVVAQLPGGGKLPCVACICRLPLPICGHYPTLLRFTPPAKSVDLVAVAVCQKRGDLQDLSHRGIIA
jgi:hypothetical protein